MGSSRNGAKAMCNLSACLERLRYTWAVGGRIRTRGLGIVRCLSLQRTRLRSIFQPRRQGESETR